MKTFALILALFSMTAFAGRFQVSIDSIDEGKKGEPVLILMSDGQVGFMDSKDLTTVNDLTAVAKSKEIVEIELSNDHKVLSIRSIENKTNNMSVEGSGEKLMYDPSVASTGTAMSAFLSMRRNYQNESQCYNRAHIWTYEEYKRTGLKSMKVFMFFTRKYIRNYNFYWWFHVTPAVYTSEGLRTLDRRYTKGLLSLHTWSNIFVRSRRACPVISKYYDYRNNQTVEDCFHIPVSMYFWQPYDIERRDRTGYEKTQYYQNQVNTAYWEAF
jgi:hypothetical protein